VVAGVVHPVHERERTHRVRLFDELRDVVDGTERVGSRPYRQQARPGVSFLATSSSSRQPSSGRILMVRTSRRALGQ